MAADTVYAEPHVLRAAIRAGEYRRPTAGQCPGFVQANLVIVPDEAANEFEQFCQLNSQSCPLLCRTEPGNPEPAIAPGADLRTDVSGYRIFRHGLCAGPQSDNIIHEWRDDAVAFLLGCSFTFEHALECAGYPVRHMQLGRNVPMYRTNVDCLPSGRFQGNLVVSMRPYRLEDIDAVRQISGHYPRMHGAPVHVGLPEELGIMDLDHPDFGDPPVIHSGEVPVFWACGVTPQLALEAARLDWAITHRPGYMFMTDLRKKEFFTP